jgi:hypothetical protein
MPERAPEGRKPVHKPDTRKYLVTGPGVHGVSHGGTIELDAAHGSTAALIEAGHIAPAENKTTASKGEAGSKGDS